MEKKFGDPIHPGEILADEIEEIGITASKLAEKLNVPKNRIYQIISEQRSITADTAIRLSIFFGTTAEFWLNLQNSYELDLVRQNADNFKHIRPYEPPKINSVQYGESVA
jgi:antitoxin HigA-1